MKPYWVGKSGRKYYYTDMAVEIRELHPKLVGAHIFPQLEALGLRDEFSKGETPHGLPFSFSDYAPVLDCA